MTVLAQDHLYRHETGPQSDSVNKTVLHHRLQTETQDFQLILLIGKLHLKGEELFIADGLQGDIALDIADLIGQGDDVPGDAQIHMQDIGEVPQHIHKDGIILFFRRLRPGCPGY